MRNHHTMGDEPGKGGSGEQQSGPGATTTGKGSNHHQSDAGCWNPPAAGRVPKGGTISPGSSGSGGHRQAKNTTE